MINQWIGKSEFWLDTDHDSHTRTATSGPDEDQSAQQAPAQSPATYSLSANFAELTTSTVASPSPDPCTQKHQLLRATLHAIYRGRFGR